MRVSFDFARDRLLLRLGRQCFWFGLLLSHVSKARSFDKFRTGYGHRCSCLGCFDKDKSRFFAALSPQPLRSEGQVVGSGAPTGDDRVR